MSIKIFLFNFFLGCLTLVFVGLNLFAFYSPFSDSSDNNSPLIALDVFLALGICAYNIVSAKNRGGGYLDIVINRIVPFVLPFIIVVCILIAKGQINRYFPPAVPKL